MQEVSHISKLFLDLILTIGLALLFIVILLDAFALLIGNRHEGRLQWQILPSCDISQSSVQLDDRPHFVRNGLIIISLQITCASIFVASSIVSHRLLVSCSVVRTPWNLD